MYISKMSARLQLALRYETLLTPETKSLFTTPIVNRWQLILQYTDDLSEIEEQLNMTVTTLSSQFADITIDKQNIGELSNYPNIIFISLPSPMSYIDIGLGQVCASNIGSPFGRFNVKGQGILLGVVDSGIDYSHPDFIKSDGTTRIRYLWDQTIEGAPPEGFNKGTEYTSEEINTALRQNTKEEQLEVVPSQDILGHGTAITGVAGGNGRGSNGQNVGIAPECDLIIVKIGKAGTDGRIPRDLDVMLGISYVMEKSNLLNIPISVLLGVGDNLTGHDGSAPLEQLISDMSYKGRCNFSVGTGNQGDRGTHTSGRLIEEQDKVIQLLIEGEKPNYAIFIWKQFIDEIELTIRSPQGEVTESIGLLTTNRAYLFGNTALLVNFAERTTNILRQQIFIWFQGQNGLMINNGIWTITLRGIRVLTGEYNIWSQITEDVSRFLNEVVEKSLTSPSTTQRITSVGAFNGSTFQLAAFSGRGYTRTGEVKPDIMAPGVNVPVPSIQEGTLYETRSGTSVAAAFVAGAYVLMMSYGLIQLNEQYFYGEQLKIYLLRNARRVSNYGPYPNNTWGYGTLCIEAALNEMLEVSTNSS